MNSILLNLVLISIYYLVLCQENNEQRNRNSDSTSSKSKRKFIQTADELKLTKEVVIDSNNCKTEHPVSVFIPSAGRSVGKYFDRRQLLRKTWVKELKELNISVYFALALNPNDTVNDELKEEADKYQDIIQFGFIDAYYNLTLKSIAFLRWITKKCQTSTHILKADDDVFVNSRLLLDKLSEFKIGISGLLDEGGTVSIDNSKWCKPYDICPNGKFPAYIWGMSYMMAGNLSQKLVNTIDAYERAVVDLEDLFITGNIAEKAGIGRYSSKIIIYTNCDNPSLFHQKVVLILGCNDRFMDFWSEAINATPKTDGSDNFLNIVIIVVIVCILIAVIISCLGFAFYKYRTKSKTSS